MAISRQIPSYDHAKHTILNAELMKEGPALHVISSMIAGFMTALTTSPVDVIKTRIMNQKSHGAVKWHNIFLLIIYNYFKKKKT